MRYLVIVILVSIAFMTITQSCDGNGTDHLKNRDIYVGTQGVIIDTYDNKFPSEVYENEDLYFVAKLTNKGAYSTNARFQVSVDDTYMTISNGNVFTKSISLQGKDIFSTFDDSEIVGVPIKVEELLPLQDSHDTKIHLSLCYDYENVAISDVCIDTDPYDIAADEKVCDADSGVAVTGGQGGPVGVSRIESRIILEDNSIRPQYKIFVTNYGSGKVLRYGSSSSVCSGSGTQAGDYNIVELTDISFSQYHIGSFNCVPKMLVLDRESSTENNYITCTLNKGLINRASTPTYRTPLIIELKYGYYVTQSKDINIKKLYTY